MELFFLMLAVYGVLLSPVARFYSLELPIVGTPLISSAIVCAFANYLWPVYQLLILYPLVILIFYKLKMTQVRESLVVLSLYIIGVVIQHIWLN